MTTIKDIKTLTREEISELKEDGENYSKIIDAFIDESHRWNKKSSINMRSMTGTENNQFKFKGVKNFFLHLFIYVNHILVYESDVT